MRRLGKFFDANWIPYVVWKGKSARPKSVTSNLPYLLYGGIRSCQFLLAFFLGPRSLRSTIVRNWCRGKREINKFPFIWNAPFIFTTSQGKEITRKGNSFAFCSKHKAHNVSLIRRHVSCLRICVFSVRKKSILAVSRWLPSLLLLRVCLKISRKSISSLT